MAAYGAGPVPTGQAIAYWRYCLRSQQPALTPNSIRSSCGRSTREGYRSNDNNTNRTKPQTTQRRFWECLQIPLLVLDWLVD